MNNGYVTKFVPREQYELVLAQLKLAVSAIEKHGVDDEHESFDVIEFSRECREVLKKAQDMEI